MAAPAIVILCVLQRLHALTLHEECTSNSKTYIQTIEQQHTIVLSIDDSAFFVIAISTWPRAYHYADRRAAAGSLASRTEASCEVLCDTPQMPSVRLVGKGHNQ